MSGYIPPAKQWEVDFLGSHCCFLSPSALPPALCLQGVGTAPQFHAEGLFPQAWGTAGCGSAHLWKLRPSLPGHSDPRDRPASNHLSTKSLPLGPQPKAPGLSPRASGQDGPRDHQEEEGGLEKRTLTRASRVARIRACVLTLKSVISAVNRTTLWAPHVAGRGSCHWTLSLEMWEQFHRWLLKAQTSQWAAPRWAHRQGWLQLCALRCERGWTGGLGLACTKRCGCLGGPAASQWAGGWEAPQGGRRLRVETVWLAERAWRLAAGGTPKQTCFLV